MEYKNKNEPDKVVKMLKYFPGLISVQDEEGECIIHQLVNEGKLEMFRMIIREELKWETATNAIGLTVCSPKLLK